MIKNNKIKSGSDVVLPNGDIDLHLILSQKDSTPKSTMTNNDLAKIVEVLVTTVGGLVTTVDGLLTTVNDLTANLNNLTSEMREGFKFTNNRIDSVEQKLNTKIDNMQVEMNNRFDKIEQRLDVVKDKLERNNIV